MAVLSTTVVAMDRRNDLRAINISSRTLNHGFCIEKRDKSMEYVGFASTHTHTYVRAHTLMALPSKIMEHMYNSCNTKTFT